MLTAKNRDHLRNPTLGNRVGATFSFTFTLHEQVSGAGPGSTELARVRWLATSASAVNRRDAFQRDSFDVIGQ